MHNNKYNDSRFTTFFYSCMYTSVLSILALILFSIPCYAQEVAVVTSASINPYRTTLEGFKSTCDAPYEEYVVTEYGESELLGMIHNEKPDLILTIGMDAFIKAKKIKDIPIVYSMVSNPQSMLSDEGHITGVSMNIPAKDQLSAFLEIYPRAKKIGVLYDPEETVYLYRDVQSAADLLGITLIAKEVHSPSEVPSAIRELKNKINAFYMLPDTTVISHESIKYLMTFSLENSIPIITFSDNYVKKGALMSLNIDAFDIGRQAGKMANSILEGKNVKYIQRAAPRKAILSINLRVARQFGIDISKEILQKSKTIN
jgi:putative ABC transport system substrate-binding protein